MPKLEPNPLFSALREACESYVEWRESDDRCEDEADNYEHNIFEKALELIYGSQIWQDLKEWDQ